MEDKGYKYLFNNKKIIMNKKVIGLVILVIIIGGVFYFLPKDSNDDQTSQMVTVTSDDGTAEIEIPDGALPEGIDASDLSIKKVSTEDVLIYELSPDGLLFNSDVTFRATIAEAGRVVPILYHVSGEDGQDVELVSNTDVEINLETSITTVSAPISHFSKLRIHAGGLLSDRTFAATFFEFTAEPFADVFVGENVSGKFLFSKTGTQTNDGHNGYTWSTELVDPVTFHGKLSSGWGSGSYLLPLSVKNVPPNTAFTGDSYTTSASALKCVKAGVAFVSYFVEIEFSTVTTFDEAGKLDPVKQSANINAIGPSFKCLADPTSSVTEEPETEITTGEDLEESGVGDQIGSDTDEGSTILALIEMSYDHTVPGEYSEVYVSVPARPGAEVTVNLSGPDVASPNKQTLTADDNGAAYFTFRIFQFGTYTSTVTTSESPDPRTVEVLVE